MCEPIVVDIDGTMSRPDRSIPGRVIDRLHDWDEPVVVATGKAFPYPVALCDVIGIEIRVIAENGGVCCVNDSVEILGDDVGTDRFVAALRDRGYGLGWGQADLINRWRETEIAVDRSVPRTVVDELAADLGLAVVDSKFAYHVKSPTVNKGTGLKTVAAAMELDVDRFVAIGDSENDLGTFSVAGHSVAVGNAAAELRRRADVVTETTYADGLLEALDAIKAGSYW